MRSISIVYKKGRRQSCHQLLTLGHSHPKRSVDDYYNRLIEKEQHRQKIFTNKKQMLERIQMRTSQKHRRNDEKNIIGTLNIASVPLHQQENQERREQNRKEVKIYIGRKLSCRKPSLFGLNHTPLAQQEQQISKSECKWQCCKLKCLFRPKVFQTKPTVLVLSVNFILNQHYRWQDQEIDQSALKHWKMLQSYSIIVWICEKQESLKKLLKYCKANGLRLDGVYMVLQKKSKRLLTVNYQLIESDFDIRAVLKAGSPLMTVREEKRMVVVNGLLVEHTETLNFTSFYNSIPILNNNRSLIHYTKIDPSDTLRLASVVKILSQQQLPNPLNLMMILYNFQQHQDDTQRQKDCECDLSDFNPPQGNILADLQEMKMRMIKFFRQSMSTKLTDRLQENNSNSVQYLIGDAIRRNYRIFQNSSQYRQQYNYHQYHMGKHRNNGQARKKWPGSYRNTAYLWSL